MRLEYFKHSPKAFKDAYEAALESFLEFDDYVQNDKYMVVVNFREPSFRKRLYVVDLIQDKLIYAHHVAHGVASCDTSNKAYAKYFSNKPSSHMSSLGAMLTGDTYIGKHGYSLRLNGLEKGKNDLVYKRSIVIHAAGYVGTTFILRNDRAGCSYGCFAVDPMIINQLVHLIKNGVFFYAYV